MRKFVVTTISESSDHYMYFINANTKPTPKQLDKFLRKHGSDHDEDQTYENVQAVVEITDDKFIELK